MGRNLPAKKYTKKNPTQTRLSFELSGGTTQFIDIAKALSTINRKGYRQGLYYYVNSVEVYNDETGVINLLTAPDTWVTKNAQQRGFQIFQKMNAMAYKPLTSGIKPKYHDFKIYLDDRHRTTGSLTASLHGINDTATSITVDDWTYAQFISADSDGDIDTTNPAVPVVNQEADNFYCHLIGPHTGSAANWTSIGLIHSYAATRTTVQEFDPEGVVSGGTEQADPLVNLFDFSTEEQLNDIIDNLATANDQPPYNYDLYNGEVANNLQHVARIGTEVGVGRIGRAAGFCVPFGLICVDPVAIDTAFRVVLNLAVGTYHGVYAERA